MNACVFYIDTIQYDMIERKDDADWAKCHMRMEVIGSRQGMVGHLRKW